MLQIGPGFKMGFVMFLLVFGVSVGSFLFLAEYVDDDSVAVADAGGPAGGPVTVTIVGRNSLFDPKSIVASPGVPVTVNFDNQDAGVLHNIKFFATRTKTGELGKTPIEAGPKVDPVSFTAPLAPGAYAFICEVHPDTMTGVLNVR